MNRKFRFVDGHNSILSHPGLKALFQADRSGATAQKALVERARICHDFNQEDLRIAFDSRHQRTLSEKWQQRQQNEGIIIEYGAADEEADTLIERWVLSLKTPQQCTVVSNDRTIATVVTAAGAHIQSVSDFFNELELLETRQTRAVQTHNKKGQQAFGNHLDIPL